jgi:hypothetical protein
MATGQEAAKRALTIGRATKTPKVVRGATASRPTQATSGKSAEAHVRQVKESGNPTPTAVTHGQTAPKPGKARVGETGTAKAVVMPNRGGSSRPTGRSWSS